MGDAPKQELTPEQGAFLDKLYAWINDNRGELTDVDLMATLFTGSFSYLFCMPASERPKELLRMAMFMRAMAQLSSEVTHYGHK